MCFDFAQWLCCCVVGLRERENELRKRSDEAAVKSDLIIKTEKYIKFPFLSATVCIINEHDQLSVTASGQKLSERTRLVLRDLINMLITNSNKDLENFTIRLSASKSLFW